MGEQYLTERSPIDRIAGCLICWKKLKSVLTSEPTTPQECAVLGTPGNEDEWELK